MVARRARRRCLHRVIRRCTPRSFGSNQRYLEPRLGLRLAASRSSASRRVSGDTGAARMAATTSMR